MIVTRFAPSPTGRLHLGSAYSALFAERAARDAGGRFLLRIEDIDPTRCRPEFGDAILEDLAWLGVRWDGPVRRQSAHLADYAAALQRLDERGLLYPCFCTRRDIESAGAAPHGADGPIYPGTCRRLSPAERTDRMASGVPYARRLDMAAAVAMTGPLEWHDRATGTHGADPLSHGDVVLGRKEVPTSYHLSVTLDDHLQGVTLVTRGEDLAAATDIHRVLQALLGLDVPEYQHHPLLAGADGRRYAKRDRSLTLAAMREKGRTPDEVRRMLPLEV